MFIGRYKVSRVEIDIDAIVFVETTPGCEVEINATSSVRVTQSGDTITITESSRDVIKIGNVASGATVAVGRGARADNDQISIGSPAVVMIEVPPGTTIEWTKRAKKVHDLR